MLILGISAFFHDSAATLIDNGQVIAAAQEERFSRKKHDAQFPKNAVNYCLSAANITLNDIDYIVFFEKPFQKFERLLETYMAFAPRGFQSFAKAMPVWLREKLFQKNMILDELALISPNLTLKNPLQFSEHHLSHAASAFYPSPFERALVLTLDGVGEWATATAAIGDCHSLKIIKEIHFPHSLGLLYSAFTYYCGFKVNSGEYKLMGLAPYGEPRYSDIIEANLIDVKADGSFRLNLTYFDFCTGLTMTNARFAALFGQPARDAEGELTQFHTDIAASIQVVTESVLLKLAAALAHETGERNLCLAGGVALNCVANGKLHRSGLFERIWVQPAAGDAGGALGAALACWHLKLGKSRPVAATDSMRGAYLGPASSAADTRATLEQAGAVFEELGEDALIARCAQDLADGLAFGWHDGRMEFGPRALGARSILADARSRSMQATLNLKVKFRESFRPFAPIVLAEKVSEWFDFTGESPYMLMVAPVLERHRVAPTGEHASGIERLNQVRSSIPAVTHVDYSARIQTVHAHSHARLHRLLTEFDRLTGVPVLVNTSFNVRGEPIVCSAGESLRCFLGTHLDRLVIDGFYLRKTDQPPSLLQSYAHLIPAD
jgi:carbamoyltransferase